ncbi:MAG: DUF2065 domain-containing protein [Hyphomicrobiaceae bacterium]
MQDLLTAIGLVLVIEGLIWAVFPRYGRRLMEAAINAPEHQLQVGGAVIVAVGVTIVWLVKG